MPQFRTLDDLDVAGRRVLVRVDLNVPVKDGIVTDASRIERAATTLRELAAAGAKVIVLAHFGRPRGHQQDCSLAPLIDDVARALPGLTVHFATETIGPAAERAVARLQNGEILVLENLRFDPREEANDRDFARALAALGDLYVNDAFSAAHRAHASTEGVTHFLPHAAGRLMQAELEALGRVLGSERRGVVALVGGAKVSTKLDILTNLVSRVDGMIIGGAMANTFLLAQGHPVGASLVEADLVATARAIIDKAAADGCRLVLPVDVVVAPDLARGDAARLVARDAVRAEDKIFDIGPDSIAVAEQLFEAATALVWNGPVGAFEFPPFDAGTTALARAAARLTKAGRLISVAGGGDTNAALAHAGVAGDFSYLSTAGGAFLEWLEGRVLPGVAALAI